MFYFFFSHTQKNWNCARSSLDVRPNIIYVPKHNKLKQPLIKKSSLKHSKVPPHVCSICLGNKTKYCHRHLASRLAAAQAKKRQSVCACEGYRGYDGFISVQSGMSLIRFWMHGGSVSLHWSKYGHYRLTINMDPYRTTLV